MNQTEIIIIDFLHKLEIPQHLRGYEYIKTGVRLLIEKPDMIYQITKELYPEVAKVHSTKGSLVERGIRFATSESGSCNHDTLKTLLNIRAERLTNGHFLASLAEAVKLQIIREGTGESI